MTSATQMVRVAIVVGMAAGGTAQASVMEAGQTRAGSEIVDTTLRSRLASERQGPVLEDRHFRDRSLRGDDGYDDRHSGDRQETGSSNRGPGSFNSGSRAGGHHGRRGGDDPRVTQIGDVRQEDRREDRRANSGGELRGLDRADHVADDHGRRGRDNARAVQSDHGNRMERFEPPDHSSRPERPERSRRN